MTGWAAGLAALLVLTWAAGDDVAAETRGGTAAFKRGDFKAALTELTPEAKKDDPDAIYTLGRMY